MTLPNALRSLAALAAFVIFSSMAQAQFFTGRVVEDSSGDAIASAELKIHKTGMRELIADLDTDRQGRFSGQDLPTGDYTIDVLKPNFITSTFPIHLPVNGIQIRLLHYGVMDGHVTNLRGEPVAGIVRAPYGQTVGATRVTVLEKQPGEGFRSIRDAALDEAGHFRFFDLPPGQYQLGMWFYGINEGSGMQLYPNNSNPQVFTIAGGEVYKDLNFLVAPNPEYKVGGKIALPTAGMKFALALGIPDQPTLPLSIALADDDGSFHFDKVPTGTYDLFAAGPAGGYTQFDSVLGGKGDTTFGRMRIQVAGSDIKDLAVPLAPARSLSVVLRAHGNVPFPASCPQSASLGITSMEPWGIAFRSNLQISVAKEQTVTGMPPGKIRLTLGGLGAGCYQESEVVVDLSQEVAQPVAVEVSAGGSIHGTLQTGAAPAAGYAIVLVDAVNGGGTSQLAFPGADGRFAFEALRPGRYRIAAEAATEVSKTRWVTNVSQMKEISVAGGQDLSIELPRPSAEGVTQ